MTDKQIQKELELFIETVPNKKLIGSVGGVCGLTFADIASCAIQIISIAASILTISEWTLSLWKKKKSEVLGSIQIELSMNRKASDEDIAEALLMKYCQLKGMKYPPVEEKVLDK